MNGNFTYHNPTKLHFGENAMAALVGELKNFGTTVMLSYGGMPKDADFNCGVDDSIRPVDAFAQTKGASGGVDFWGNCWEWTTTKRGDAKNAVKGGAFDSKRTDCRTESKATSRDASKRYPNVTIRLVRESRNANQQDDLSHGDAESRRHTSRYRDSASSGERSRPDAHERRGKGRRGERGPRARGDRQDEGN